MDHLYNYWHLNSVKLADYKQMHKHLLQKVPDCLDFSYCLDELPLGIRYIACQYFPRGKHTLAYSHVSTS